VKRLEQNRSIEKITLFSFYVPSYMNFVKETPIASHAKRTTVQHWQLRDLINCSDSDIDELYHVYKSKICKYNLRTKQSSLVQSLDFLVASFCVRHGYMAAGGHDSQLTVKDLKTNELVNNAPVGGAINNACNIAKHRNGDILLFASNNDNTIKVFSLQSSNMLQMTILQQAVPINYTAVSPDGKYMASVGDNSYVNLYEMRDSRTFIPVAKMSEYYDGGFSCCFDASSTQLAAASQDGTVAIWDLRKVSTPLAKLHSEQKHTKGAARCVKFSPTLCVDLLVYAEHESYIHVIDTRTYQDEQIINVNHQGGNFIDASGLFGSGASENLFSNAIYAKDISGLSFTMDSRKLFVAMVDQIQEYPVDMLSRRVFAHGDLI
jgi:WD40 repeat protein